MRFISAIAIAAASLGPAAAGARAQDDPPPCLAHENGSAIDFWLGDWDVTSMGGETTYGENHIVKDLKGCAVFEDWTGAGGGKGKSLFYFNARNGAWRQIWVTGDTARPGGLKHKQLIDMFDNGAVRFQGEITGEKGPYLDRTTLTPLAGGDVRQHIEISTDGGQTWQTTFDARYSKMANTEE